jgi:sulfur carrier protein ThiS
METGMSGFGHARFCRWGDTVHENRTIEIRLFASLRKWRAEPTLEILDSGEMTVADCIRVSGVPDGEVAIIFVDGKRARPETEVSGRAVVELFPLMGGG